MKNKLGLKLKIEKFVKEQLWQLVVVVVLLTLFAFIFDKYIECVLFCVSHTVIRNSFCKQYHCGTTALCLFLTLSIGWFGISTVLPTSISILSSIPLCFIVAFLGFIAQDRVDKIKENSHLLKDLDLALSKVRQYENIDIYKLTETELRQFGASKGLSDIQQDILVHRVIDHLKISEICSYRNYGRTTIKYHLSEIKRKLNIDTL